MLNSLAVGVSLHNNVFGVDFLGKGNSRNLCNQCLDFVVLVGFFLELTSGFGESAVCKKS